MSYELARLRLGSGAHKAIAVHGWLDNAASFVPLAAYLPSMQVDALDLPGHGHTPLPCREFAFIDSVPVLARELIRSGPETILIGHSMGGAISLVLAAGCSELVRAVIAIDGLGPVSDSAENAPKRLRGAIQSRLEPRGKCRVYPQLSDAVTARMRHGRLSETSATLLMERATEKTTHGWRLRTDQALRLPSLQRFTEEQVLELLASIHVPVLHIAAADSEFSMPSSITRRRAKALRNATFVEIPGPHHLHMESPAACGEQIEAFVATL